MKTFTCDFSRVLVGKVSVRAKNKKEALEQLLDMEWFSIADEREMDSELQLHTLRQVKD